jgi:hypothetical protein
MTLLDAPAYDRTLARRRRKLVIGALLLCGVAGIVIALCWNLPAEHRVNQFSPHSKRRTSRKRLASGITIPIGKSTPSDTQRMAIRSAVLSSTGAKAATMAASPVTKSYIPPPMAITPFWRWR